MMLFDQLRSAMHAPVLRFSQPGLRLKSLLTQA